MMGIPLTQPNDEPFMQSIADRIEIIKRECELKNTDLAKIAGVTRQAVGQWINNGAEPAHKALINIREKLGYSEKWIMEGGGSKRVQTDDEFLSELRKYSSGLSEDRKAQLLDMARLFAGSNEPRSQ